MVDKAVKHPPIGRAKPTAKDRTPLDAPTRLFLFGNPFALDDQSQPLVSVTQELSEELVSQESTPFERRLASYAAAYLLAWSPAIWRKATSNKSVLPAMTAAVEATARLMACVPTYVIGTTSVDADPLDKIASAVIHGIFARWPNFPVSVPISSLTITTALGAMVSNFGESSYPPLAAVDYGGNPETALDLRSNPSRIIEVESAEPLLVPAFGDRTMPSAKSFGKHDVSIVLTQSNRQGYIAQSKQRLDSMARWAPRADGFPRGYVLEVAISRGTSADSAQVDAESMRGEVAILDLAQPVAVSGSVHRQGSVMTLELLAEGQVINTRQLVLPGHGRLISLSQAPDGLYLGNRMMEEKPGTDLKKGQGDNGKLAGVEVGIYENVPDRDCIVVPNVRAADTGAVVLSSDKVSDGIYSLRILGSDTFSHAGPDTPIVKPGGFKERVWRQHRFLVEIQGGEIIAIDQEPVPSKAYRLLIDPVWMKAYPARSGSRGNQKVELVVVHALDDHQDIQRQLNTWIDVAGPGEENTAPHYIVGRDGTVVKVVDEKFAAFHAATGNWRNKGIVPTGSRLPTLNPVSVGIETAHRDDGSPYPEPLYLGLIDLLNKLVGLDQPTGQQLSRFRAPTDPNYVDIAVRPTEIIAHGDNKFQGLAKGGPYVEALGGKHDPGLSFDWGRLQSAGLGLLRQAPPVPWVGNPPLGVEKGGSISPNPIWSATQTADDADYRAIPDHTIGGRLREPTDPLIREQVWKNLKEIGYLVGNTPADGDAKRTQAFFPGRLSPVTVTTDYKPLQAAIRAFRTHFFSGALRTRPRSPAAIGRNEDVEETAGLDRMTVVWIYRVLKYLKDNNYR